MKKDSNTFFKNKVICYIMFSYLITWILWLPLLLNYQFHKEMPLLPGQFYLASFGPLLSAVITSFIMEGKKGFSIWIKRSFSLKFSKKWIVIAVFMPFSYSVIGIIIHRLILGEWIDFSKFGLTSKLPGFSVWMTAFIWIVTFGIGEESGWRGFLLPELHKKYSLRWSSLIVALIWIFWHLPAFFFNPTYLNMGPGIIGWAISLTFGSVLLAWIADKSEYSILPVLIWHGGFDLITASDQAEAVIAMVCSILVIFQGIVLIKVMAKNETGE